MSQLKLPPSNLTATATSPNSIRLDWQNNGDYFRIDIFQSVGTSSFTFLVSLDGTDVSHEIRSLVPNTSYGFQLKAVYFDMTESEIVGPVWATTPPPLSPPQSIQAVAHGSCIDLTWQSVSLQADCIEIHRDSGSGFSLLATTWANEEFFRDETANAAQDYSYKLRVKQGEVYSDFSDIIAVSQFGVPDAPTAGSRLQAFSDAVIIGWQAPVSGAPVAGYIISDAADTEIVRVPKELTSAYISGLTPDTNYLLKVKAYNGAGQSSALEISASTADWYAEKKIDYLSRNSKLRLVFAFLVEVGSSTYCWTSERHSAFDSYICYHGTLGVENFSYRKNIQPFYQPGLVGSSGEVVIFNTRDGEGGVFDTLVSSTDFLGAKCRLVFGDRNFSGVDEFLAFSGGVISSVKLTPEELRFSFLDPFSCLDSPIELEKNPDDEYIPIAYGYNWTTGHVKDAAKKKVCFVAHPVQDILSVQKNGVEVSPDDWRKNLSDGSVVFSSAVELIENDIITAYVAGKRNAALELVNSPADIIVDLVGENLHLFDTAYLAEFKRTAGVLSFCVDYPETSLEIIKRILCSSQAGIYTAGDRARIKSWAIKTTGLNFSFSEIEKITTEKKSEDQIYQVKIGYSQNSDISEEEKKIYTFGSNPRVGEKIELAIYGNEVGADTLAAAIGDYAEKIEVGLELPFLVLALEPLEVITTPAGNLMVEKIENNLRENASTIAGRKQ